MAFVEIGDLVPRILGCGVQHGNRNHRGKPAGDAAREEKVEADLISSRFVHIRGRMPRIN